ncbi:MAG TPA: DUF1501 domain-containing protein [Fimbriiglobus sp.]|jgi:hypothetical protein
MSFRTDLSRRHFLRTGAVSLAVSTSGWFGRLATAAEGDPKRKRACILLWLNGGPATIDLWDLKPGHENGGPFRETKTKSRDLRISEHLSKLAEWGDRLGVVRSLSTREGDHERAVYLMRTGVVPNPSLQYPTLGSLLSKELGDPAAELPNFVSIGPQRFFGFNSNSPGFLGPKYAPLMVGDGPRQGFADFKQLDKYLKVQNIERPTEVDAVHGTARLELLRSMQDDFAVYHPGPITASHTQAYESATRLMLSDAGRAFDLSKEKNELREKYGKTLFGQGCLLARRLVEKGVPFVEVTLDGWDTHANNFDLVKKMSGELALGWSSLMADLKDRGLLDTTTIVCAGEFGRTPRINPQSGRDHFPSAWSAVIAGGGIKGGQAYGRTSADGVSVEENKVSTADFLATVCKAVDVDPDKQNMSNIGRPIRIVDHGTPIADLLS